MSKIQWTEQTWNPITGCSRVSAGCRNCYAEVMTRRLQAIGQPKYQGLLHEHGRFNGKVRFDEKALLAPLKRKKPTTYFVNSMSDLFHENVTDEWIDKVFAVMALAPQHTFQILTKRAERMREYLESRSWQKPKATVDGAYGYDRISRWMNDLPVPWSRSMPIAGERRASWRGWPLPNVWLGVSAENQEQADERIPHLLETPAAVRWLSAEPLLEDLNLKAVRNNANLAEGQPWIDALNGYAWEDNGVDYYDVCNIGGALDWIVVGGESGPNARPCNIDWIRSVVQQCQSANVPVFVKQLGGNVMLSAEVQKTWPGVAVADCSSEEWTYKARLNHSKGGEPSEWPEDLRVRMMPREAEK